MRRAGSARSQRRGREWIDYAWESESDLDASRSTSIVRGGGHSGNEPLLPPLPVLRERVGVRVISNVELFRQFEITLILTFSRRTGRRDQIRGTSRCLGTSRAGTRSGSRLIPPPARSIASSRSAVSPESSR